MSINRLKLGSDYLASYSNGYLPSMYLGLTPIVSADFTIYSEATDFISTANVTDSTEIAAVQYLVSGLKQYGLWDKLSNVYPFVGGTSSSMAYNLKDASDVFSTIVWGSGMSFGTDGITGDGTSNSYGDTKKTFTSANNDLSLGVYILNNSNENATDMGVETQLGAGNSTYLQSRNSDQIIANVSGSSSNQITASNTNSRGFFILRSFNDGTDKIGVYKDGAVQVTGSQSVPSGIPSADDKVAIGAFKDGLNWTQNTSRSYGFSFIGTSELSEDDVANLNLTTQRFIQILGR